MSGLWRPVGPEPTSTYWLRRTLVIGVLAVVVAVLAALVGGGRDPQQVVPAVPASLASSAVSKAAPTGSATRAPASTKSAKQPSGSTRPSPSATGSAPSPDSASTKPTAGGRPSGRPDNCGRGSVRVTLSGDRRLRPKEDNRFTLSIVNRSEAACRMQVTANNFELSISSGRDRIWTSSDCATSVEGVDEIVKPQQAVSWKVTWDGLRSAPGCTTPTGVPRPGTYLATARLIGASPVELRMVVSS